ncbi:Tumor suppressor p53-binding protein 1 [Orchesella cincta]|uniref:Tumor suppressor p53-binding protein 1 n=1 Tax=Orchesella cincta TaxID=48709 RepID=A0A1D2MYM9_ORCCI|nr:Tumor suppressor p53-binding protein 1 [Orchesella cincta]
MVLQINGDGSYSVVPKLGQTSSPSPFPMVPTVTRPLFRRPRSVATRTNNSGATISWQNVKPSPLSAPQRPQQRLFPKMGFATRSSGASETIVKLPTLGATAAPTRHVPTSVNSSSTLEKAPKKEVAVEYVDVSKVERRGTLWGIVAPVDLVFAKRENGLFYSGHVKSRGDRPNSWKITFDNGLECSVSDSEILPIRILGAGTIVTYPAESFHIPPRLAQVVGQKIELNRALKSFSVKYAIKFKGNEQPIWATRDELCLAESTAITLRRGYALLRAGTEDYKQGIANVARHPVITKKEPN